MENHIGLAFTSDAITYAQFNKSPEEQVLADLDTISYPFTYDDSVFFKEENIVRLANLILNHFESSQIETSSVSISIESNLCPAKIVHLPPGLQEKEEAKHIQWDLSKSLLSSLNDYVYLKTETTYNRESSKEVLVIALKKNIIEFFQSLVDFAKLKLKNLSSNQLATEVCFKNAYNDNINNLTLLHRVTQDRLESICLLAGNLFMSNYEKVKSIPSRSFNEILLDKITGYTKYVEEYFEQREKSTKKVDQIFVYGMELTESLTSLIHNNMSIPLSTMNPIKNLKLSPELSASLNKFNNVSGFTECIGVALDAD